MPKNRFSKNKPAELKNVRNRIISRERMDVSQLKSNDRNYRGHPDEQRGALEAILSEVGQVGELYAYHSERNGGALTLVDGHLRKKIGGEWDVAITDLTDSEADKILLTYDAVSAMASADKDKLDGLLRDMETESQDVADMLEDLAKKAKCEWAKQDEEEKSGASAKEKWEILISCESEQQQTALLNRLADEGLKVKSLIA